MLTSRQKEILKFIVNDYTARAQPVSSKVLIEKYKLPYSSATIRSECVFLEEKGLLEKNHFSSGRIPSSKGYRYYVDHLMNDINSNLGSDVKSQLEVIFNNRKLAIEDVIQQTATILSEMTNLITIVVESNIQEDRLKKIELVPLNKNSAIAIFITDKGHVVNKTFTIGKLTLEDLILAVNIFNSRLIGTKIVEMIEKMEVLKPVLEKKIKSYDYILQAFITTLVSLKKPMYSTHGLQYMLENFELNDVNKIKEIIRFINSYSPFHQFLKAQHKINNNLDHIQILIGDELGKSYDDIAVISTDIQLRTKQNSQLALIGPKRIDYDKMAELLDWISKKIADNF